MPQGAEQSLPELSDDGARKTRPDLKLVPPLLEDGDFPDEPDLNEATLARSQGLEPIPASSPEHNEATTESLINVPHLRAARDKLVSAWADLRKYEHGLTGAALGIVARKSRETARVRYEAAQQAYKRVLWEQAQKVEREFGTIEKAKALVSAMEQMTDARAEVIIGKSELSRRMYQWWQKMGELNVGNVEAVKNILSRQEDDSAWKGNAKKVGRFIARGMSLRSAVGAAMVGSGFWFAYAGWRTASAAAGGAATHKLMREGMLVGSRELLAGSESKVRREYGEAELASMSDRQLGEIMQAYGARLGFHGEKLQGNERFERVKNAFLSRFGLVEENVQDRVDMGWDEEPRPEEDEREAMMARKDAMLARLDGLAGAVEDELAKQEKQDRKHRLIAAASALAVSGAIMYFRPGGMGTSESVAAPPEIVAAPKPEMTAVEMPAEAPITPEPVAFAEAPAVVPPVETPAVVEPEAMAEAAPVGVELSHGVAGVYEIKSGQGLLHAANEFQKAQHDEIVAGIKTQHPEWFAKGEDYAIRRWRMEQVRDHGGALTAAGEKYRETLHPGAKIRLEFDDTGYPHLTSVEDKHITHHELKYRPRIKLEGLEKWGDDHPIRFSEEGAHGVLVPHRLENGELVVDVRDVYADDRPMVRFIDPNYKQSLSEHFDVQDDPAALDLLVKEARTAVKKYAAREAALAHLNEQNLGDSPVADVLRKDMLDIVQSANKRFGDAQVFRPVSLTPEEVGAAAETVEIAPRPYAELYPTGEGVVVKSINFPETWTGGQQEAARRLLTYHEGYLKEIEKSYEAYVKEHGAGPTARGLRENIDTARAEFLTDGEHATRAILRRIDAGQPLGNVPTIELAPGASTIEETMVADARDHFNGWVAAPEAGAATAQ